MINERKCIICGSENGMRRSKLDGQIYCGKHRMQRKRYGKILKRTRKEEIKMTNQPQYKIRMVFAVMAIVKFINFN